MQQLSFVLREILLALEPSDPLLLIFLNSRNLLQNSRLLRLQLHLLSMLLRLGEVLIHALIKRVILHEGVPLVLLQQKSRHKVRHSLPFKLPNDICLQRTHHHLVRFRNHLLNSVWLMQNKSLDLIHKLHVLNELPQLLCSLY